MANESTVGSAKSRDSKQIYADDWQDNDVKQKKKFPPIIYQSIFLVL